MAWEPLSCNSSSEILSTLKPSASISVLISSGSVLEEATNYDFDGSVLLQHEAFKLDLGRFQPFAKGPVVDIVGHSDL
ncbi:hypothetical protein TNCV_1194411 [Trichonephila clavipes]|nr:hypothetical protein TNCV_1194411 [Trichonephila clavipes]